MTAITRIGITDDGKEIGPLGKLGFVIALTGFVLALLGSLNIIAFLSYHLIAIATFLTLLSFYVLFSLFKSGIDNPTIPRWRELLRGFVPFLAVVVFFGILNQIPSINDALWAYVEASFRWFPTLAHYFGIICLVLLGQFTVRVGNSLWSGRGDFQHLMVQDETGIHFVFYQESDQVPWKDLLLFAVMVLIGFLLWFFQ